MHSRDVRRNRYLVTGAPVAQLRAVLTMLEIVSLENAITNVTSIFNMLA
jgi:hypothetical protein